MESGNKTDQIRLQMFRVGTFVSSNVWFAAGIVNTRPGISALCVSMGFVHLVVGYFIERK